MEEILRQPPVIDPPLMNAAGMLGLSPDLKLPLPWEQFGAFVTNPISTKPRKPASRGRWQTFAGGALMHSGHPNAGFRAAIKKYETKWAQAPLPVIVHLLAGRFDEMARAIERLETLENILAVEIGLPEMTSAAEASEVVSVSVGELPIVVRIPVVQAQELGPVCYQAGAAAVSLGPPRGALPGAADLIRGRIYGPGTFPLALQVTQQLARLGIPVIGAGGVYTQGNVDAMMDAGALAVQLDLSLWRGDWFVQREE